MPQNREDRDVQEVVRAHAAWVFACAKRRVRDEALAEDVAQAVFILLWQKGARLGGEVRVTGWLYRAVRYCAGNALRLKQIRQRHEREAAMAAVADGSAGEVDWGEVWPELEWAVDRLGEKYRAAVLLRFYRQMSFAEVGQSLGISEKAATKRVERALEKLRGVLAKKGVVAGAAALGVVMAEKVTAAAPAGLVEAAMASVGGGGTGSAGVIAKGAMKMMAWAKLKVAAIVCLGILAAGGAAVVVGQAATKRAPATAPSRYPSELAEERGRPVGEESVAYLTAKDLVEGWERRYGNIVNMRFSVVQRLVKSTPPTTQFAGNQVRWDDILHVERVVKDGRYHARVSRSLKGFSDFGSIIEESFDGTNTMAYHATTGRGEIYRGRSSTAWGVISPLAECLLSERDMGQAQGSLPAKTAFNRHFRDFATDGHIWPDVKVRPRLEIVGGEPCHVLERESGGFVVRVWVAHGRSMLPMKYENLVRGELVKRVEVEAIQKAMTDTGPLWYPARARTYAGVSFMGFREYEVTVSDFTPNARCVDETFRISFPKGTQVYDKNRQVVTEGALFVPLLAEFQKGSTTRPVSVRLAPSEAVSQPATKVVALAVLGLTLIVVPIAVYAKRLRKSRRHLKGGCRDATVPGKR